MQIAFFTKEEPKGGSPAFILPLQLKVSLNNVCVIVSVVATSVHPHAATRGVGERGSDKMSKNQCTIASLMSVKCIMFNY